MTESRWPKIGKNLTKKSWQRRTLVLELDWNFTTTNINGWIWSCSPISVLFILSSWFGQVNNPHCFHSLLRWSKNLYFTDIMTFLSRCYYQSSNFLIYILCQSSSHFPGFKDLESVFPTWLNFLIENFFLMFIFCLKHFISSLVLWTLVSSNFCSSKLCSKN